MLDSIRNLPPQAIALAVLCCLTAAAWLLLAVLRRRRVPWLPYEPRRQVPWQAGDVLAVVAFHFLIGWIVGGIAYALMGTELVEPVEAAKGGQEGVPHAIARMLAGAEPWLIAVGALVVVVVTPIVEELIYRVLLQGWLEAAARQWRRQFRAVRWRFLLTPVAPIVLSSVIFAAMHYRTAGAVHHRYYYFGIMLAVMATNLLTVAFALAWTHFRVGATAADWGWAPQRFWRDARAGAVGFLAIAAPLYLLQLGLGQLLPQGVAPDPAAIFLFALLLGTLYHRTHRGTPGIVAHAMLNATSLVFLWLQPAT